MLGKASLACLLVREGANLHLEADDSRDRMTPLQLCPEELTPHLTQFARERCVRMFIFSSFTYFPVTLCIIVVLCGSDC